MAVRTGLYLRVSHIDSIRSGGTSIPAQLSRLREEAERADEQVVETFVDQAKSGTSSRHRQEYQRLLQWVREGKLDKVRIESVDRGHRNELDRREFEAELLKYHVILQYAGEPEKLPPAMRQFNRSIRGAFAELESAANSERVYKRMAYIVRERKRKPAGRPEYGLRLDGKGWLEPDPETYPVLLWMLRRRGEGAGYAALSKQLNNGISIDGGPAFVPDPPRYRDWKRNPFTVWQDPETGEVHDVERKPTSGRWHISTVKNICRAAVDGIYTGVLRWGRGYGKFADDPDGNPKQTFEIDSGAPLVPQDILEAVQAVEFARQERRGRRSKHEIYLVRPTCGRCGGHMAGDTIRPKKRTSEERYFYRRFSCMNRKNFGSCNAQRVDATYVEQYVINQVLDRLRLVNPAELDAQLDALATARQRELENGLVDADTALAEANRRREQALATLTRLGAHISDRLRDEYIRAAEECLREIDELEASRRIIEAGLIRLKENVQRVRLTVTQPLRDTKLWTDNDHREELRRALGLLVKRLVVFPADHGSMPERIEVELAGFEDLLER